MRKKLMTAAVIAAVSVGLTACGTAQTNNTPTPTAATKATTTPAVTPTVEPRVTSMPGGTNTTEPTAAPPETLTEIPPAIPTEVPVVVPTTVPTEVPAETPTAVPTVVPTEVPTATPTTVPTEAPTLVPTEAPMENPEAEVSDFATMLKELHRLETYEERAVYVEKLDKSRYQVEEKTEFDLITHADGIYLDRIETYDIKTGDYITEVAPDSRIYYPAFSESVLIRCANIPEVDIFDHVVGASAGERPTGENYLMTITDLTTGETDPWGVKIHYAEAIVESVKTSEWGMSSATVGIDPDSPVKVAYCTVEDLINEKNNDYDRYDYYDMYVTMVEPVRPQERYDEDWNPTGEYFFYETSEETVYVEKEDLEYNEWGDYYYCYDDYGMFQKAMQDENGTYYYIWKKQYEVPIEERGYTIAEDENFGSYLVDKDGALVTESYQNERSYTDPNINTWNTLKYYQDVYDPRIWSDFVHVLNYEGEYALTDMKAEEYPYLNEDNFDKLIKHYMEVFDITLDEEVLAIRASIPEEWGSQYKDYHDKECVLGIGGEMADSGEVTYEAKITIKRPEHWYFDYTTLAVKDDSIRTNGPAHIVEYLISYREPGETEEETKKAALDYWLWHSYLSEKEAEQVKSLTVKGNPVFYAETTDSWDEGWKRTFVVMQDAGFSEMIAMEIETYDLETEAEKLLGQFLLDDNYTVTQ